MTERAGVGDRKRETRGATLAELRRRIEVLERRNTVLEGDLLEHGPAWDEVANRTALGRLNRSTWRAFCQEVEQLPQLVSEQGFDRAHAAATGSLLGKLYTMAVAPPGTLDEARTLDRLRLMIVNRALFLQLSGSGRPYDRIRQSFLAATARTVLRPAVPIVFKRSPQDFFEPEPSRPFSNVEVKD